MELNQHLPTPFLFNSLKHHRGAVLEIIEKARDNGLSKNEINTIIKKIGNSMIDFYYGELSLFKIAKEIELDLKTENCYYEKNYHDFIQKAPGKYASIVLSDHSTWTLVFGRSHGNYIHLHPSRGSEHTMRVRAIALKTVIILKVFFEESLNSSDLVSLTNEARLHYLDESPIKNELYTRGLKRILKIL